MYGVSLTSGQPVTIVQKFPDLLQQVIYETCEWVISIAKNFWTSVVSFFPQLEWVRGSSWGVHPDLRSLPVPCHPPGAGHPHWPGDQHPCRDQLLHPFPQDYVLVESGCTCRPKYATPGTDPNPQDIIPNFSWISRSVDLNLHVVSVRKYIQMFWAFIFINPQC